MALSEAFGRSLSPAEAKCFAERLLAGLEHMYNKRRQATSGAKLQAPVLGLAKAISSSSMVAAAAPIEGPKKDLTSLSPSQILYARQLSSLPEAESAAAASDEARAEARPFVWNLLRAPSSRKFLVSKKPATKASSQC